MDEDKPERSHEVAAFASALQQVGAMMEPVLEAATGYRKQAVEQGFDEMTAAMMASSYHDMLMSIIRKQQGI